MATNKKKSRRAVADGSNRQGKPRLDLRLDPYMWDPNLQWETARATSEVPDGAEGRFTSLSSTAMREFSEALLRRRGGLFRQAADALADEPAMATAVVLGALYADILYGLSQGAADPTEWMEYLAGHQACSLMVVAMKTMRFSCPACDGYLPDDPTGRVIKGEMQWLCPHCDTWVSSINQRPASLITCLEALGCKVAPEVRDAEAETDEVA